MSRELNYGRYMHRAFRGVIAEVLSEVAERGLPGKHHFYIGFDTTHPGVDIADHLRELHPENMTVVMQDWFDDLAVMDDRFAVTLNFSNTPERLVIPYDAILTFVDPSVEFGLRFDSQDDDEEEEAEVAEFQPERGPHALPDATPSEPSEQDPAQSDAGTGAETDRPKAPQKDAEVVSLDKFRRD